MALNQHILCVYWKMVHVIGRKKGEGKEPQVCVVGRLKFRIRWVSRPHEEGDV